MDVMAVVLRSLSDFKKFLRKPGATVQIVQNTFVDRQDEATRAAYRQKGLYEPRTLRAMSKKAAVFDVKGHDTMPLNATLGPPDAVVYRCSLPSSPGRGRQRRPARRREDDEMSLPGM
jgi:hypothetical protein